MKRTALITLLLCLILRPVPVQAWGFWAHQRINRMAVFTLPAPLLALYKKHLDYLTEHAVDPDHRRYAVEGEAPRHYIDLDRYGTLPFADMPRYWKEAVARYSEDTLNAHGIVPWHVNLELYQLTEAFRNKDLRQILRHSADIGHYIADAHVPLHTTRNYNGQLSGQRGIHGLWESRLPELFGEEYNYFIGTALLIQKPQEEIWKAVLESHTCLDSVFRFERKVSDKVPDDRKYSFENRNEVLTRVYSLEFSQRYHQLLDGQVERRLRQAILRIGSFWYTAWVQAGQPDLKDLLSQELDDKPEKPEKNRPGADDRENQEAGDPRPGPVMGMDAHAHGACCMEHSPELAHALRMHFRR